MNDDTKKEIDNMSYEDMFRFWRFAPSGHRLLVGEVGAYFAEVWARKREEVGPAEHTRISKMLGW